LCYDGWVWHDFEFVKQRGCVCIVPFILNYSDYLFWALKIFSTFVLVAHPGMIGQWVRENGKERNTVILKQMEGECFLLYDYVCGF
jgi:hypothetical protein